MTGHDRLTLPRGSQAPRQARAWVSQHTTGMPEEVIDDALLVTSELVTNAVLHGDADIVLSLEHLPSGVRISVSDLSDAVPVAPPTTPDPDRPQGRGMIIVAARATKWGIHRHETGPGKTVWAELTYS